jgi:hypothetical protein
MHDTQLHSTQRARRILDAWEHENMPGLRAELRFAQQSSATGNGAEEEERLDLLNGIAAEMERELATVRFGHDQSAATCFRLLAHLAASRPVAIRSEKPSAFPYSQSVRRISACR